MFHVKHALTAMVLLGTTSMVSAQVVIPAHCPPGFVHEGEYCVGEGHRLPFSDFIRGGRFFGRPFIRPWNRPGYSGMGRPAIGHRSVHNATPRSRSGHGGRH